MRMKWTEHVAWMEDMINAYNILIGKPEQKITLGRCKRRWESNTRRKLKEVGWEVVK